jgi:hypothetical protein
MKNVFKGIIPFLILFIFSGCAAIKGGATRSLPPTVYPVKTDISQNLKAMGVVIEPFSTENTDICGGHYEGLLQVRQPWFFGVSGEQKQVLYGNLRDVARYALIDEFVRQGFRVYIPKEFRSNISIPKDKQLASPKGARLKISGTVKSIELNTYVRGLSGTMEGYGSSGNYWEAEINFSDIVIRDLKTDTPVWTGSLKTYCKLTNCPMKLDWTMFTLISKSLDMMKGMATGPLGAADAIYGFRGDYTMEDMTQNPPEIAARLGTLEIIDKIKKEMHP